MFNLIILYTIIIKFVAKLTTVVAVLMCMNRTFILPQSMNKWTQMLIQPNQILSIKKQVLSIRTIKAYQTK